MPSCYVCGSNILTGQGLRRSVHTGATISGFNLSSIFLLNWLLNSLISKRSARIRNSYSLRTICPTCAMNLDAQERTRIKVLLWLAGGAILAVTAFLIGSVISR
jgi:hypothetical protein